MGSDPPNRPSASNPASALSPSENTAAQSSKTSAEESPPSDFASAEAKEEARKEAAVAPVGEGGSHLYGMSAEKPQVSATNQSACQPPSILKNNLQDPIRPVSTSPKLQLPSGEVPFALSSNRPSSPDLLQPSPGLDSTKTLSSSATETAPAAKDPTIPPILNSAQRPSKSSDLQFQPPPKPSSEKQTSLANESISPPSQKPAAKRGTVAARVQALNANTPQNLPGQARPSVGGSQTSRRHSSDRPSTAPKSSLLEANNPGGGSSQPDITPFKERDSRLLSLAQPGTDVALGGTERVQSKKHWDVHTPPETPRGRSLRRDSSGDTRRPAQIVAKAVEKSAASCHHHTPHAQGDTSQSTEHDIAGAFVSEGVEHHRQVDPSSPWAKIAKKAEESESEGAVPCEKCLHEATTKAAEMLQPEQLHETLESYCVEPSSGKKTQKASVIPSHCPRRSQCPCLDTSNEKPSSYTASTRQPAHDDSAATFRPTPSSARDEPRTCSFEDRVTRPLERDLKSITHTLDSIIHLHSAKLHHVAGALSQGLEELSRDEGEDENEESRHITSSTDRMDEGVDWDLAPVPLMSPRKHSGVSATRRGGTGKRRGGFRSARGGEGDRHVHFADPLPRTQDGSDEGRGHWSGAEEMRCLIALVEEAIEEWGGPGRAASPSYGLSPNGFWEGEGGGVVKPKAVRPWEGGGVAEFFEASGGEVG